MTAQSRLKRASDVIAATRLSNRKLSVLSEALRPRSEAEAYQVQDLVHGRIEGAYGPRIGYKIGCTTRVMQDYLGIPNPCHGGLFRAGRHVGGVVLEAEDYGRIGVECEIAVRIGDAPAPAAGFSDVGALGMVDAVFAAIEIVDDRYADWRNTDTPTLIADDFFSAGCVLGPAIPIAATADLGELSGVTRINGAEAGHGVGRDVMGHPGNALAWIADKLAERGRGLMPGEIVLTGSLVETRWLDPGDNVEIEIAGLGEVTLSVASRK